MEHVNSTKNAHTNDSLLYLIKSSHHLGLSVTDYPETTQMRKYSVHPKHS